jgi:hypothetical protein
MQSTSFRLQRKQKILMISYHLVAVVVKQARNIALSVGVVTMPTDRHCKII